MAINKVTLAKVLNKGTPSESVEYIYPKTSTDNVPALPNTIANSLMDNINDLLDNHLPSASQKANFDQITSNISTMDSKIEENQQILDDLYTYVYNKTDYAAIKRIVGLGFAQDAYPYGSTILVHHSILDYDLIFEPVGYNLYSTTNSMTIMMKNTTKPIFCINEEEVIFYNKTLSASQTYRCINIYDGSLSIFSFKVPADAPTSTTWCAKLNSNITKITLCSVTNKHITYSATVDLTTSSTGTLITDTNTDIDAVVGGYNVYNNSDIDNYLNLDSLSNWPTNTYKPAYPNFMTNNSSGTAALFQDGLPSDFDNIVRTVSIQSDSTSLSRKYYLPSYSEITGSSTSEGTQFPLYNGMTNSQRIKYDNNGTARDWFFRTKYSSDTNNANRFCTTSGIPTAYGFSNGLRAISIVCTI